MQPGHPYPPQQQPYSQQYARDPRAGFGPSPHGAHGYAPPPPADSADLFVMTLPPPVLKAAGIASLVTGMTLCFMAFRLFVFTTGTTSAIIQALMILSGISYFAVAKGITGGKLALAIVGFVMSPVVLVASIFTLFTGSIAGAFGVCMVTVVCVLIGVSIPAIRRIAIAKDQMKKLDGIG